MRDELDREAVLNTEALFKKEETQKVKYFDNGNATTSTDASEIVVGVSPAFGSKFYRTLARHSLSDVLKAIKIGIESNGKVMRLIKCLHTADTSF